MQDRKQKLFSIVVAEHIQTGRPVSSLWLAEEAGLDVSSATIRNDLMALEQEGLLMHPHTSAGRVPTEGGYRQYINAADKQAKIGKVEARAMEEVGDDLRSLAKVIAAATNLATFIAFNKNETYLTGLSGLASQPEFAQMQLLHHLTEVADHMDENMVKVYDAVSEDDVHIYIGSENPVSNICSLLAAKTADGALIGLIGPMRMDYAANVARLTHAKQLYEQK